MLHMHMIMDIISVLMLLELATLFLGSHKFENVYIIQVLGTESGLFDTAKLEQLLLSSPPTSRLISFIYQR